MKQILATTKRPSLSTNCSNYPVDLKSACWTFEIEERECVKREEWISPLTMYLQPSFQRERTVFQVYMFLEVLLFKEIQVTSTIYNSIQLVLCTQVRLLRALYKRDLQEPPEIVGDQPTRSIESCGPASVPRSDQDKPFPASAYRQSFIHSVNNEQGPCTSSESTTVEDPEPLVALLELDTVLEEVRKVEKSYLNGQINKIVTEQTRILWDRIVEVARLSTKNEFKLTAQITDLETRLKKCYEVF